MRFRIAAAVAAGLLILGGRATAQQYNVRTMAAPKVRIADFHSFHLLPTPRRHNGARTGGRYDPMEKNSVANRSLRQTVSSELVSRGYFDAEWMPDFVVAVYATANEALALPDWEYGYWYWPHWWSLNVPDQTFPSYEAGTVVIDFVNPETLDVVWRGIATARVGADPLENARDLVEAAAAIIDKVPRARPIVVVGAVSHTP